jgi:shikimate kinase
MTRTGHGSAHAAVGILNATATGIGCSLAVTGGVTAEWTWRREEGVSFAGPSDSRLAQAVAARIQPHAEGAAGASVRTASTFPPGRGLKTSSGAASALVRAARDALGHAPQEPAETDLAIAASVDAGVTLTGAFDDHAAVRGGGCHLTDNGARRILASVPVPSWHVAVWVPDASIPKAALRGIDAKAVAAEVAPLRDLVRNGRVPEALTRSGAAFARLYAAAGLPVTQAPAQAALDHGALGAGLSGTGPAVAALFERPAELPDVPGGAWAWARVVGGTA